MNTTKHMSIKMLSAALAGVMAFSMIACGDEDPASGCEVTTLADYENLDLPLSDTEETITDYLLGMISTYAEVTDRDVIENGDYVLVDYVGYLDGEPFDRGAAQNQYIWVDENNGYIPGFTDGLVGATVGDIVVSDVTFPEEYPNNPDMNGAETQFEFTIYGIYESVPATKETLTDEDVANNFGMYLGVATVDELFAYIADTAESLKESAVMDYMIANSEVVITDEYLEKRVGDYIAPAVADFEGTDEEMWTYIEENYGVTKDDISETVYNMVKSELIYEVLAEEFAIEVDEDAYTAFAGDMMANYGYTTLEELYAAMGEDAADGEAYLRRLYSTKLVNEQIAATAAFHYEEPEDIAY